MHGSAPQPQVSREVNIHGEPISDDFFSVYFYGLALLFVLHKIE